MFASNTSQVSGDAVFVEDVFQNWLYTGNGSTQTITNGIDLAGKGGLVWMKKRSSSSYGGHLLVDTANGTSTSLSTNITNGSDGLTGFTSFNANGFSMSGACYTYLYNANENGSTYTSWTFRKQPKFFDVVTYTGDGTDGRNIAHSLGSVPGCIVIKSSSGFSEWFVYHRSLPSAPYYLKLNRTDAQSASFSPWSTAPTSTTFSVNDNGGNNTVNSNGATYVAYLFAHNAGGFGLTGTDNVISCGSFTTDGSGLATVTLGYEPQWVLVKKTNAAENWQMLDVMRGMSYSDGNKLFPNTSGAEAQLGSNTMWPLATGFGTYLGLSSTYIYIAIRRGPMKTPTSGTSVFAPAFNQSSTGILAYLGQPTDFWIRNDRTGSDHNVRSRMTGGGFLLSNSTAAEGTQALNWWDNQVGVGVAGTSYGANSNIINYLFRRAPGFFDEVCWTGDGTGNARSHNLTVYPELVISKLRSGGAGFGAWNVQNNISPSAKQTGFLNTTAAFSSSGATSPTATVFYPTDDQSGATYVTYLFASCPGVQSIQSYVGDGTTGRTINCGFTGGARFVCIKATSTTGSWWTFDSARGIVTNNDPALQLNSTAAEVTSADAIDTAASGFIVNQEATCSLNASGVTYLVWAIA